jgi:hypothetical protein
VSRIRLDGQAIDVSVVPRGAVLRYRLRLPVPALAEPVPVRIEVRRDVRRWTPRVYATVPDCQRHRYKDDSLCMWFGDDPAEQRWTKGDGFTELLQHIRRHLFQEACCRAGEDWPGEEAPGEHPRPSHCQTCGGIGP